MKSILLSVVLTLCPVISWAQSSYTRPFPDNIGAQSVTPTGGTKSNTVDNLFGQTLNVLSFTGVDPTGATDSTTGIQAAVNYLMANGGGYLFFPAGTYKTSATINVNVADNNFPSARVGFRGAGAFASIITSNVSSGSALSFIGGSGANSHLGIVSIQDMSIEGNSQTGIGLNIVNLAVIDTKNLQVLGYDTGIFTQGSEKIVFGPGTFVEYNNKGILGNVGSGSSGPNSISIRDADISHNLIYGAYFQTGTDLLLDNSCFEYNGPSSQVNTSWGIRLDDFGSTNGAALTSINSYFEGNGGQADIWINNTSGSDEPSVSTIIGGEFNRNDSAKYTKNNILISGTIQTVVNSQSVSYNDLGSYTPSSSNPYWSNTNSGSGSFIYDIGGSNVFAQSSENVATYTEARLSVPTAISIAQGGTAAVTAAAARVNLGVAASGANSDITSLTGLTTPLSQTQGGTGATGIGSATFTPTGGVSGNLNQFLSAATGIPGILSLVYYLNGNQAGVLPAIANFIISWNYSNNYGEADFFNGFYGGNSLGNAGFSWYQWTSSSAVAQIARLDALGNFSTIASLSSNKLQITGAIPVASLPTCNSGTSGQEQTVSDALAPSYAVALVGGGSVNIKARCNGSSWVAD